MDVAALAVAIVSIMLSLFALLLHLLTWLLTGSWVRVKYTHAYPFGAVKAAGPLLSVTAVNVGRTPVEVRGWGLELPDGGQIPGHMHRLPFDPPLPCTLEGGHEQSWHIPKASIVDALRDAGFTTVPAMRPFVALAGDKRKYAKRDYVPARDG